MHVRGDLMVPVDQGKAMAASIPGARFVTFPGRNHFFLEQETASDRFFEEAILFLNRPAGMRGDRASVIFTSPDKISAFIQRKC